MATQVSIDNLSTWLSNQPANTKDTPYELEITGITTDNIGYSDDKKTIGYILNQNKTKYVDLRETNIPSIFYFDNVFMNCISLVYPPLILGTPGFMRGTFSKCTSLKEAPVIPDSVTNMNSTFKGCTSLVTAPVIPSSVDTVYEAFSGCESLVNAPAIPDSVTSMDGTFHGCTSLVRVPIVPKSITNMSYTFQNCTSLATVTIMVNSESITNHEYTFDETPLTLKICVPKENLAAWKSITPSDWGLTSTDVFEAWPIKKRWYRIL